MRRILLGIMTAFLLSIICTSCEETTKKVKVYRTEVINVSSSLNMRSEPSASAQVINTLKNGDEVVFIEESGSWSKVKHVRSQTYGWVKSEYIGQVPHYVTVEMTMPERYENAGQPISAKVYSLLEEARAFGDSKGNNPLLWALVSIALAWGLYAWIYFDRTIRVWQYVMMSVLIVIELLGFVFGDAIGNSGLDGFWLNLLYSIALISLLLAQWCATVMLMSFAFDPYASGFDSFVEKHVNSVLIAAAPLLLALVIFKSVADLTFILFSVCLLVGWIVAIVKIGQKRTPMYILWYSLCFFFFLIPFSIVALNVGIVILLISAGLAGLYLLGEMMSTPGGGGGGGRGSGGQRSIIDDYGHEVDVIDSNNNSIPHADC